MIVALVHCEVLSEQIDAFKAATLENARHSVLEPGIARFDVLQQSDNPAKFVLVEAFRSPEAQAAHRETAHYLKWRDVVASMMAAPRVGVRHDAVFPADAGW